VLLEPQALQAVALTAALLGAEGKAISAALGRAS
jgi:hypothetical protein